MSDAPKNDNNGPGPSKSADSPTTQTRKLKERVNFFEKVWTGIEKHEGEELGIDVQEIERRIEEEKRKHIGGTHLEFVTLRSSPKRVVEEKLWVGSPIEHVTLRKITQGNIPEDVTSRRQFSTHLEGSQLEFLDEERKYSNPQLEHVTLRKTPLSSPKHLLDTQLWKDKPIDVIQIERKLAEERNKNKEHTQIEQVLLRPTFSPQKQTPLELQQPEDFKTHSLRPTKFPKTENFEETFERTVEEGDISSGSKVVKFEKIIVRKTTKEIIKPLSSRTPSEEHLLEDSAYHSHGNGVSKSSSVSSLTGRFPSEENLRRTPSRDNLGRDDWDSGSSSSKHTTSGSEWYNEYRHQSFLQSGSKLDFVRSKSQYDSHIAEIRGKKYSNYF